MILHSTFLAQPHFEPKGADGTSPARLDLGAIRGQVVAHSLTAIAHLAYTYRVHGVHLSTPYTVPSQHLSDTYTTPSQHPANALESGIYEVDEAPYCRLKPVRSNRWTEAVLTSASPAIWCRAGNESTRRLEFELGAWFEGACGFALVLALSRMMEHGLGPFGRAELHRSAIHLIGRVVSLRSRAAMARMMKDDDG